MFCNIFRPAEFVKQRNWNSYDECDYPTKRVCFRKLGIRPWTCHRSCGWPPASHRRGPGSIPCWICVGQSDTLAGFRRVLKSPLPVLIPSIVPHSFIIIRDWYYRPSSGRRTKRTHTNLILTNLYIFRLAYFIASSITCENRPSADKAAVLILKLRV